MVWEDLLDASEEIDEMGRDGDDDMHQDRHGGSDYRRIEVITGRRRRRAWTVQEKASIVAASAEPGANISDVLCS